MASLNNPLDKDQEDQNGQGPQQVNSGSQAATIGSGDSTSTPQGGTKSGRFTNITNYLKANSGYNAEGGGLAGKIAGNIQNQGDQINQQTNQAKDQFNNDAEKNHISYDEGTVNTALNDPTNFVQNPENTKKFQSMLQAKYNGPQGIQNADQLKNNAQNLQQTTAQTTNEGGRFNLLHQMFNKPSYNAGQQKLDNLLLQGNPNQLNKLTDTRNLGNQSLNTINQAQQQAGQTAANYTQEAQDTANKTQGQFSGSVSAIDKALADKATAAQAARDQTQQQLSQGINTGVLNDQTSALLNSGKTDPNLKMGDQSPTNLYNLNLNNYLKMNDTKANEQNIASADDYNKINALKNLAGGANIGDTNKVFDNFNDPTQAGKFGNNYDFNRDQFNQDLSKAQGEYNQKYAPLQQQLQNIQLQKDMFNQEVLANGNSMDTDMQARGNALTDQKTQLLSNINNLNKTYGQGSTMDGKPTDDAATAMGAAANFGNLTAGPNGYNFNGKDPVAVVFGNQLRSQSDYDAKKAAIQKQMDIYNNTVKNGIQLSPGVKIICNELARQGIFDQATVDLDNQYGERIRAERPELYANYIKVATPIVKLMRYSSLFTKCVAFFAKPWSDYMVSCIDLSKPKSKTGWIINKLGEIVCNLIGKLKV